MENIGKKTNNLNKRDKLPKCMTRVSVRKSKLIVDNDAFA